MSELTRTDTLFVASRLPGDVRELLEQNSLYLGGGFIRATIAHERPNDIDLFGPAALYLSEQADKILKNRCGARLHTTQNALTVLTPPRLPVQFITRWLFDNPVKVAQSFDFTIAQAVIWFNVADQRWMSYCADGFYPDLAARRLVYTCPVRNEDAGGSILRMRKFMERGYHIQAPALAHVVARLVSRLDPCRVDTADEAKVGTVLLGLLREVDPLTLVDNDTETAAEPITENDIEAALG